MILPAELNERIEAILADLYDKTRAECIMLADVSGQLIEVQGRIGQINPVHVAALAAGNMAAMTELGRQIGEKDPGGVFLHEGKQKSIYLFSVAQSFFLIVIFQAVTPIGLVRLFAGNTVEQLHMLVADFEAWMSQQTQIPEPDFGANLADELDKAFEGL